MTAKEKYEALCKMTPEQQREFYQTISHKIDSHLGWYRGQWEKDKCSCGQSMLVPSGAMGKYQCNSCADRAEGLCD